MRYLWLNYGKKSIGLAEGEIEKISRAVTGIDLTRFYEKYLYGIEELPLQELLSDYGITYNLRATTSVEDKGGKPDTSKNQSKDASFGARFSNNPLGAKIVQVFTNESAELAGLSAGDIVIAINDLQVKKSTINTIIDSYAVEDELIVHAFRRDELKVFTLQLNTAELTTCYLQVDLKTDSNQHQRKEKW